MITKLFVPCSTSSCMNLLELEDTLQNYIRQFLLISMHITFTNRKCYKQLEQLAIHIVLAGTLNSFKILLDKHWKQNMGKGN